LLVLLVHIILYIGNVLPFHLLSECLLSLKSHLTYPPLSFSLTVFYHPACSQLRWRELTVPLSSTPLVQTLICILPFLLINIWLHLKMGW
jgi:hypothetical protein